MAPQAHVAGIGTCLPAEPVDNEYLARALRISREWIDAFVGTRTRHFARDPETGRVRWSLADLCAHAADRALADAGADPAALEFVVLATATPDALMPATVNEVAERLGVNQVPTFQLQSGCAGAVQALDLACGFIASGRHRTGLVLGGDVCAKHLDLRAWAPPRPAAAPGELVNLVLFGDGAGAAVLTARPDGHALAVRHVVNRLTGTGRAPGQNVEWFGAAEKPGHRPAFQEDYKAIERLVPAMAAEIAWEILDELGWKPEELDYMLPPQLSGRMTAMIAEELGLGAEEVSCVAETGNTGNALPFLQLERLAARIRPGQRAVAVAVESSKWIKAGLALECARPGAPGCEA
jgi:3-oxoacyl-[acyl-carrier-protein] synthase-3